MSEISQQDNAGHFFQSVAEAMRKAHLNFVTNCALRVMANEAGYPLRNGDNRITARLKQDVVSWMKEQTNKSMSDLKSDALQYQVPRTESLIQRDPSGVLGHNSELVRKYILSVPFFSLLRNGINDFRNSQCEIIFDTASKKIRMGRAPAQVDYDLDQLCLATLSGTMDTDSYVDRFFMCAYPHIKDDRTIEALSILLLSPTQHARVVRVLESKI